VPFPEPYAGLVPYSYLWKREHEVGREEGTKDRPRGMADSTYPIFGTVTCFFKLFADLRTRDMCEATSIRNMKFHHTVTEYHGR
jgi:hypothetical protein